MQTNRRWIRSWLPWNRDRILSLVAVEATSSVGLSTVEPLHREANTGCLGWGPAREPHIPVPWRLPRLALSCPLLRPV